MEECLGFFLVTELSTTGLKRLIQHVILCAIGSVLMLNFKRWEAVLLFSVIVPIGLLATFRLTGVLHGPLTISRTTTADTVYWNMSRPAGILNIEEKITNTYHEDAFSSSLNIHLWTYVENKEMYSYNDDVLWLSLTANANTSFGFIYSMHIESSETDEYAVLDFGEHFSGSTELYNLTQKKVVDGSHLQKAVFEAISIGQPKECELKMGSRVWVFFDENDLDHWVTITLEIVYFDGAIYRQVSIPIRLGILLDKNDSFETAFEIQPGTYPKLFLGRYDAQDYYKIYLAQGQKIDVHVDTTPYIAGNPSPVFELYLYDPTRILKANSTNGLEYYRTVSVISDSTGYWYIETRIITCYGFYTLTVIVQ